MHNNSLDYCTLMKNQKSKGCFFNIKSIKNMKFLGIYLTKHGKTYTMKAIKHPYEK